MRPIAALIALLALALGAAPAAAERLAVESAPFTADAYGDLIAGQPIAPPVEPSGKPFDLDGDARRRRARAERAGLFVTYRTDIVPTCCSRATL